MAIVPLLMAITAATLLAEQGPSFALGIDADMGQGHLLVFWAEKRESINQWIFKHCKWLGYEVRLVILLLYKIINVEEEEL